MYFKLIFWAVPVPKVTSSTQPALARASLTRLKAAEMASFIGQGWQYQSTLVNFCNTRAHFESLATIQAARKTRGSLRPAGGSDSFAAAVT